VVKVREDTGLCVPHLLFSVCTVPPLVSKIIIGATRCQILRLKYAKFDFRWVSGPDMGELTALPHDSLAVFKGPTSKGRERGEGKGK